MQKVSISITKNSWPSRKLKKKHVMKKLRLPFGKRGQSTKQEASQQPATTVSWSIYRSISKIPFYRFEDRLCDGNIQALVITGTPPEEELHAAWIIILQEYSEGLGHQDHIMYKTMYREIEELRLTLEQIESLVGRYIETDEGLIVEEQGLLQVIYSRFLCGELNRIMHTNCKFNWDDQKTYQAELKKIYRRSRGLKMKLDLKLIQFAAIEEKFKDKGGKPAGRDYFTSMFIELSDFAKYQIPNTIVVAEYLTRIKKYNHYYSSLKAHQKK